MANADHVRAASRVLGALACAFGSLFSSASAQTGGHSHEEAVTFESVARAERELWLDVRQQRRVFDATSSAGPRWLSIDEHLRTQPAQEPSATDEPRFRLDLLGVSSQLTLAPEEVELRSQLHRRHAGFLQRYGSLRIEDPARARQNYHWLTLEHRQRLGRDVVRVAVIPRRFGSNPWVLDVDVETSYPLYRAEYDAAGTLLAELEVTSFQDLRDTDDVPDTWWEATLLTENHADLNTARARFSNVTLHFPDASTLPPGFALSAVKVVQDDLRPEPSIVASYSDGIDELFVVATMNAPRPSVPLPAPGPRQTYGLLAYRDANVGQYLFHDPTHQVRYMVIGKHGQAFLEPLAKELLIEAVGSN